MKILWGIICVAFLIVSCTGHELDPNNPELSFTYAKEPYDDEHWEVAVQKLGEFKSRFPYSRFAIEAELLLANCQFELGHFSESAIAYEQFAKLHPKHDKVDYAMFRVGESYWKDSPDDIDREQEFTGKALAEWRKLEKAKPESPYAAKGKSLMAIGERRLAESQGFIARFYCKREIYHACVFRAERLIAEFPQYKDLVTEARRLAAESYRELAREKKKDPTSDKNIYVRDFSEQELNEKAAKVAKGD